MHKFPAPRPPSASVAPTVPSEPHFLVIGYGSELHGDDGVGPRMANLVAGLEWPGVRCLALTQLTPDLAAGMALAKAVVFVDASIQVPPGQVQVDDLDPENSWRLDSHHCTPRALLRLTRELYGQSPRSWLIRVGASAFELGRPISPEVDQARHAVLREMALLRTRVAHETL